MDSHPSLGVGGKRGGYSKAQMRLQKILAIICSIPPPHHQQNSFHGLQVLDSSSCSNSQNKAQPFGHKGFHIDLNLELTSSPETEDNSVCVDSKETKSNQEITAKEEISFEEERNPNSETDVEDENKETEPFCNEKLEQEEGSLPNLLTDETEELSSENGDLEPGGLGSELGTQEINSNESIKEGRDKECRVVDLYGRFDEVRTKRGRRRVLPSRYKDSLLQPLVRSAGSRKRQRLKVVMKS